MDYVITQCCNYPLKVYERFIGTLYDSGFTGKTVIFIFPTDEPRIQPLKEKYKNVEFIPFAYPFPSTDYLCLVKYSSLYNYLKDETDVRRVLSVDSRDVVFQKNFSEFEIGEELCLFREDVIIKDCPINSAWAQHFNSLHVYGHEYAICSGTIMGNYESFMQLIKTMLIEISLYLLNTGTLHPCFDQSILNYCYYTNKIDNVRVLTNEDNLVNTLCYGYKAVNEDGKIVNSNNEVSWICHQYDRFDKSLINKMNEKSVYDFS